MLFISQDILSLFLALLDWMSRGNNNKANNKMDFPRRKRENRIKVIPAENRKGRESKGSHLHNQHAPFLTSHHLWQYLFFHRYIATPTVSLEITSNGTSCGCSALKHS